MTAKNIHTLDQAEIKRRQERLQGRIANPISIDNGRIQFTLCRKSGAFHLTDLSTGELWCSNPFRDLFCEASLWRNGVTRIFAVDHFHEIKPGKHSLLLKFRPKEEPGVRLDFCISLKPDEAAAEFSYDALLKDSWNIQYVRLLCDSIWVLDSQKGYVIVPFWIGRLFPAEGGMTYTRRFRTFARGGCRMQMIGMVKNGSGCLVSWNDPYVEVELRSNLVDSPLVPGTQMLSTSFELSETARRLRIDLTGKGGYVELARAYGKLARKGPYYHHWRDKLKENPDAQKFFGAPDFKPFVLRRILKTSRFFRGKEGQTEDVRVAYTFDEAAQVAEHLRNDLGIDKGLFVLAGWIHRGYDNQHPDILPAAAECGGNEGLAHASRRIRACGYLFGLHDNYQDMYRDAPSWDERYIQKLPDGSLHKGGNWAGGQAWLTCSKMALELAKREKTNLPMVKKLFSPTAYFIDTTFAVPLFECHDPIHPMTRWDDMKWKRALCDYARKLFGTHGSEKGVEWGLPHSHYFEGILSRGRKWVGPDDDSYLIPLFELVYHDCIAMYTHQSDRAGPHDAPYILYHLSLARMPLYRFGPHLYWKNEKELEVETRDTECFARGWDDKLCPTDAFIKNTYEFLSPTNELAMMIPMTDHSFLNEDRSAELTVFGENEVCIVTNAGPQELQHQGTRLPPFGFVVNSPAFVAYHALNWGDIKYNQPTLITMRSLDGKPLDASKQVRLYRAYGEKRTAVPGMGKEVEVERERILTR